jgi:hypothetical protein
MHYEAVESWQGAVNRPSPYHLGATWSIRVVDAGHKTLTVIWGRCCPVRLLHFVAAPLRQLDRLWFRCFATIGLVRSLHLGAWQGSLGGHFVRSAKFVQLHLTMIVIGLANEPAVSSPHLALPTQLFRELESQGFG